MGWRAEVRDGRASVSDSQTKRFIRDDDDVDDHDVKQKCIYNLLTECVGVAVTPSIRNREIIDSNLDRDTVYHETFSGFLQSLEAKF
jgi:hypothetical protein